MAKKSIEEMMKKIPEQPKAEEKKVEGKPAEKTVEEHKDEEKGSVKENPTAEPEKDGEGVAENTGESGKIDGLPDTKPTETGQPPVELTDGVSEKAEDNKETKPQAQPEQPKAEEKKVVVTYIGGGTWRDEKGMAWANEDRGERIMKTRQYTKSEYDKRADLHFMVKYKSMTAVIVE